ncbi:MAG: S1 domain-containing RNA-binding protein [Selenomonadaceae bacterium]|nr:S1 domain-containing RNA-binding protein [Selenomonadaceae bacterium]MDY2685582.1 S1 domain-containing RNA-binding protein [Selenomonadaceae bacterium]
MSIEVGSVVEGVVTGITNFGAFVELPEGKTGLVHISEVADDYVKDVHDYLQEQEKIKVKVLSVDERGKVALSIKRLQEQPENRDHSRSSAPHGHGPNHHDFHRGGRRGGYNAAFEDKLSRFLKDSDARLTDLRRKTDSKRGGRGSRHSN